MLHFLILCPLVIALMSLFLNRSNIRVFSLIGSLIVFILNLKLWLDYLNGTRFEYEVVFQLAHFMTYHVGVNSIALILMLLSSSMIFLSFLFLKIEEKAMISCIFFLEFAIMGLFSSLDALLFYIFWEFSLLPLIYIIGVYGKDYKIGIKFFIYAFAGSILMLLALIYQAYAVYKLLNIFTFNIEIWKDNTSALSLNEQILLFLGLFIAFAIKAPLFPFHTWAPKLYTHAPVLVCIMLVAFKMAPFGFLHLCLPLFPDASIYFKPLIIALCIVSVIYNALIAYHASNLKQLISYSSISHLGIMILGIFSFSSLGLSGAVFYMFAHGIVTTALFLMAELLYSKYGTLELCHYHSLASKAPLFTIFFALILLGSISLPLTISFVGEFLILLALAKLHLFYAFLAGFVVILGAIYMLNVFRKMFFMQGRNELVPLSLDTRQILCLVPIVALIFYLGIVPRVFLEPLYKDTDLIIEKMQERAIDDRSIELLNHLKKEDHAR